MIHSTTDKNAETDPLIEPPHFICLLTGPTTSRPLETDTLQSFLHTAAPTIIQQPASHQSHPAAPTHLFVLSKNYSFIKLFTLIKNTSNSPTRHPLSFISHPLPPSPSVAKSGTRTGTFAAIGSARQKFLDAGHIKNRGGFRLASRNPRSPERKNPSGFFQRHASVPLFFIWPTT